MLAFVKSRRFLTIAGFLLLALFIWYAGPYFAFADYRPLEGAGARLLLIVLSVAAWLAIVAIRRLLAARATGRFAADVANQAAAEEAGPTAEALELRERFEEAVSALKGSVRSGRGLYDLPWYVIIGAPGSGKTTALVNSGLKFPLEQRVGKAALRGVGGTRNCDWWFTDEAVFLDTAGRYTTQDSDKSSDAAAWGEFVSLLVKYRKRRPLNGVILAIAAPDLMTLGGPAGDGHVEAARRRLDELHEQLQIDLPVYVMVTKCDLVAGFTEYFDDLAHETRSQVWGVTFPYEETAGGRAAALFPSEFDRLMARLNGRVFARIDQDRDPRRRTKIFAFPQQMAALREPLSRFVGDVFEATRLDTRVLLRGVYFTSGTQEGTPIDRLLGAIARRYGVRPDAVAPPSGRGKAYFVGRMLKDVIIAESGLAGVNRRLEMRKAAVQLGSYAAAAVLVAAGIVFLSISYGRNRAYVERTGVEVAKIAGVERAGPGDPIEAALPRLDRIRSAVTVANQYRDRTPWSMRWGLYQGNAVGNSARDAYVRELDAVLLPQTAARIEERLGQYGSDPEMLFEYLKAYLMLGQPGRLDREHLQAVAEIEWQTTHPGSAEGGASLAQHFNSLVDYAESLRLVEIDPRIVAQARSSIGQASVAEIAYRRLKRMYQPDAAKSVRLDQVAGVGVERVIRRRSGTSLTEPLSGFYTRQVFKDVTSRDIAAVVKRFAADDWVWGEDKGTFGVSAKLSGEVADLYERDYIETWDYILDDLEIVPFSTVARASDALAVLAGAGSPLKGLLAAVVVNTTLVEQPGAASGAAGAAKKAVTDRLGGLLKKLPQEIRGPASPGALVTAHFQPIHQLMAGEPGNAPIDQVLRRIAEMQNYLGSLASDPGATPPDALTDPAFREITRVLRQETALMPPFIQAIASQVGVKAEVTVGASASSEMERRYRDEVLRPCSDVLQDRYPFTVTATRELPMVDFTRLFGYGGLFDNFFAENLEQLVDTSGSAWAWRPGAVAGSREMLETFQAAARIRELFFRPGTPVPDLRFTVDLSGVDRELPRFVLEIDGQAFDSQAPKQVAQAAWPGPLPGRAAARIETPGGQRTQDDKAGAWGLFRLFDRYAQRVTDTRFVLVFDTEDRAVRVTIDADRVDNPFARRDWQRFRCAAAPGSLPLPR